MLPPLSLPSEMTRRPEEKHSQVEILVARRSGLSRGNVGAYDAYIVAGGFESLLRVVVGYKSGVVVQRHSSLAAEACHSLSQWFVTACHSSG